MKKLVLIALFTAFCLNLANAYDSYSNESLIVIPDNHHKYKKRRYQDRYDDDVVIYMDVRTAATDKPTEVETTATS